MSNILHTRQLELLSIKHLEIELTKTGFLNPYLNAGDTEPSWDGYIYILKQKNMFNKNSLGKVLVQVKDKYSNILDQKVISYPVEIRDLENYLHDGGVLYFVIYINRASNLTFYYAQLEPIKIKKFLDSTSPTQNKKNIELKKLPNNLIDIVNIFKSFLFHRKKQISFIDEDLYTFEKLNDNYEKLELTFTLTGLALDKHSMQNYIDINNVYLYAKIPEFPTPIPLVENLSEIIPIEKTNLKIGNGEKIFYTEQIREIQRKTINFKFGDSFKFSIDYKTDNIAFNYKISPLARKALIDIEFLLSLYKNEVLQLMETLLIYSLRLSRAHLLISKSTQILFLVVKKLWIFLNI